MSATMNTGRSIAVGGEPYQYEADAAAGINLATGERWFGTAVRWRAGIKGRWHKGTLIDVHPFDFTAIEAAVEQLVRREATP